MLRGALYSVSRQPGFEVQFGLFCNERGTSLAHSTDLFLAGFALAVLLLLAAAVRWLGRGRSGRLPYFSRKTLLSQGEKAFYHALARSIPQGVTIAAKVRLADLIDCAAEARKAGFFSRISQKHVDFVLIDFSSTALLLVIELDDQTHRQRRAMENDAFKDRALAAAGIPILRVAAKSSYNLAEIRAAVMAQI
jgi:very-short-patch-repair endonuclease